MIRVLVVDPHPIVREGVAAVLSAEPDIVVVGQAGSGEAALAEVERLRPDVVMLDLRLPGMRGPEACSELKRRHPGVGVVMLASSPHEGSLVGALNSGARGFVRKESEPEVFRHAVRAVAKGEDFTDPRVAHKLVPLLSGKRRAKGPFGLSLQEMRVLALLPRGFSNRDIGVELGISEDTVKTHVRHIMQKMHARDRAEAASIAVKGGLV